VGDPNTTKLLESRASGPEFDRDLSRLCTERLARLDPALRATGLHDDIVRGHVRSWLDLGCNDGTILHALARRYPALTLSGLELVRDAYEGAARLLQARTPFEMRYGSWWDDDHYPRGQFDVVSSVHGWPVPQDYAGAVEAARAGKLNTAEVFYERFDADYSYAELARFVEFAAPGGVLVLKTWDPVLTTTTGPVGRVPETLRMRVSRLARRLRRHRALVLDVSRLPGTVILLGGPYLVLRIPR